mgnify:CR=1 FL=1
MALLLVTLAALVIVWETESYQICGLDSYRIMLAIFLSVALLLQATARARSK